MSADRVDYDESLDGRRREAPIAAANGWIALMGVSLSCGLAGLGLNTTGCGAALGDKQPAPPPGPARAMPSAAARHDNGGLSPSRAAPHGAALDGFRGAW